ncbi:MAG: TetR/AcrR family transcriptional regulator [Candidatus Aminicenantes bacterium]|jgi:AcrR family transcriptional regulator
MGIIERRQREKKKRHNDIVDAAEKVFFSQGMENATMDDVAAEAELSKGTLYIYFKSKEDLYLAITKRGLDILTEMFKKASAKTALGIEKIYAIGQAYRNFSKKHTDYFQAMAYFDLRVKEINSESPNAKASIKQGEEVLNICAESIQCGIDDGTIRPDIDPKKAAIVLWGQTNGILQLTLNKGKHMKDMIKKFGFGKPDEIIAYSFDMIRLSLQNNKEGG